ncbi:hypothetical protein [Microvirga rosea]|uniref:hypothetical protein n=1 Tax=Microvirga rosea TaxID=2715425 RepID=UPI001D0B9665|nr:hypothetical protein [Microvirga rosea]MCB8821013.1 hypothetical protein [Microvirga rosea]
MASPSFSTTALPPLMSGGADIRIDIASPEEIGAAVVEVRHTASPIIGAQIGVDMVLQDARSRIAAIAGLSPQEIYVSARAWHSF